jgi:type II secretion system protein N
MKNRVLKFFSDFAHKWPLPTEGKKYFFLLALLLLFSFLVSAVYFFPVHSLKGSVERDLARTLKTDVAIGKLAMVFPLALQAKNVRTTLPLPNPYHLKIDSLLLNPVWSSFIKGKSAYTFSASLNQGTADGEADEEGNFSLNLRNVRFSLPVGEKGSLVVGGVARDAVLSGKYPPTKDDETSLSMDIEKLELLGSKSLGLTQDVLPLGQLRFQGKGRGKSFKVEQLNLSGGAIEGEAKGMVILRTPVDMSNVRLNVMLRTDPEFPEIGDMISLIKKPTRDGSYQIRLMGTLRRPILR